MKKKILMLCMGCFLVSLTAKAQWVVSDPGNLAQGIINAAKNIVHTSSTATNMANSFQETVKIYLAKPVVILLALLVNLYRLLKIFDHIAGRRGRVDNILGGVDDALGQIPGVGHYPLGVCLACRKKADTA